jgi:succinyl-diaminopimelate desuccinylase
MVPDFCEATLADGRIFKANGKSAHGSVPEDGENAVGKVMAEIEQTGSDCFFAKFYNDTIGLTFDGGKMSCALRDERSGALTLNAGMLSADQENMILSIDIRYPITYSASDVQKKISERVSAYGVTVSLTDEQKGVYKNRDGALIRTLLSVYREITGDGSGPLITGGGTYARAMPNIVAFGPMLPGRECTEHQRNENFPLEDWDPVFEIYRRALRRLAAE